MNSKTLLLIGAVIAAVFLLRVDKRKAIIAKGVPSDIVNRMTAQEVADVYELLQMFNGDVRIATPSADLQARLDLIGLKYNIFT